MKYAFGSGSYGYNCVFDNIQGPFDSVMEACNAASELFELSGADFDRLKRNQYLDLTAGGTVAGSGADYVEIFAVDADFGGDES